MDVKRFKELLEGVPEEWEVYVDNYRGGSLLTTLGMNHDEKRLVLIPKAPRPAYREGPVYQYQRPEEEE